MKKSFVVFLFVVLVVGIFVAVSNKGSLTKPDSSKKNYVVGILNPHILGDEMTKGFIDGLASAGYIEGKNLTFVKCEADKKAIDSALKDMAQRKVDLIFSVTTPVTKKAKQVSEEAGIPVVFAMFDPVRAKVVNTLRKPGGNITGVQIKGGLPKAIEKLVALQPDTKKIFVPIKYDTKAAKLSVSDIREVEKKFDLEFVLKEVNTQEELFDSISSLEEDIDAVFVVHSIFISSNTEKIAELAAAKQIVTVSGSAKKASLLHYGLNRYSVGKQVSRLGGMVLDGTHPSDIPSEVAEFFLQLNLKTAKATNFHIDDKFLRQADFIVR